MNSNSLDDDAEEISAMNNENIQPQPLWTIAWTSFQRRLSTKHNAYKMYLSLSTFLPNSIVNILLQAS